MTNNDELALKLKAAAEKAGAEEWQVKRNGPGEYEVMVKGSLVKHSGWSTHRPVCDEVDKKTADFIATASPANILALLAERDADKKRIAEQQDIIAKQEKWIKDVETTMISATDRAEAAEKLVAELERDVDAANARVDSKCAKLCNQDEEIEMLRQQVAGLEESKANLATLYDMNLCDMLPGPQYMDPPDGGQVEPLEQVARMVEDYRLRIAELEARTVTHDVGVMNIGNPYCEDHLVAWTVTGGQLAEGIYYLDARRVGDIKLEVGE